MLSVSGNLLSVRVRTHRKKTRPRCCFNPAFPTEYRCSRCRLSHFAARCDRSVQTNYRPAVWNWVFRQCKMEVLDMCPIIISMMQSLKSLLNHRLDRDFSTQLSTISVFCTGSLRWPGATSTAPLAAVGSSRRCTGGEGTDVFSRDADLQGRRFVEMLVSRLESM